MAFSSDSDALALELAPPGYRATVPGQTPMGRILAQITGDDGATPPQFSWKQRSYDSAGNLFDTPFGMTGSPTALPARENNNQLPPSYPWEVELTPRVVTQSVGMVLGFDLGCGQAGTGFITNGCGCAVYQPRQWAVDLPAVWSDGCCGVIPGNFTDPPAIPNKFVLNYAGNPSSSFPDCIWTTNIAHAPNDICVSPPYNQYVNVQLTTTGNSPNCGLTLVFTGVNPNNPATILFVATYHADGPLNYLSNIQLPRVSIAGTVCQLAPNVVQVHPQ